jgi:aquaporin Z
MAIAAALTVSIYSIGPVSGGHLNPAVSLAIWLSPPRRRQYYEEREAIVDDTFSLTKLVFYVGAQLLGGLAAGGSFTTIFNRSAALNPGPTYGFWEVGVVETVFTAMLAFVVLNVACEKRNNSSQVYTSSKEKEKDANQFFALAIGFVIVAGAYSGGPVSGAVFNPAVALGIEATSEHGSSYTFAKYVLFQMLGGIVAALLYRITRPAVDLENEDEPDTYKLKTKMISQFIGTWMMTFTAGLAVNTSSASWKAAHTWPLATGACYMSMVYAMGDICHGYFNPAVTLAFTLSDRSYVRIAEGIMLTITQLLAGLSAGYVYAGLGAGCHVSTYHTFSIEPELGTEFKWVQNCVGEIVFTGVIAFVAMAVTSPSVYQSVQPHSKMITEMIAFEPRTMRTMWHTGLAVGLSSVVGGVAMDLLVKNGGMLNPALTLSAATVSATTNGSCWVCCLQYLLYEFVGGIAATVFFRFIYAKDFYDPFLDNSL